MFNELFAGTEKKEEGLMVGSGVVETAQKEEHPEKSHVSEPTKVSIDSQDSLEVNVEADDDYEPQESPEDIIEESNPNENGFMTNLFGETVDSKTSKKGKNEVKTSAGSKPASTKSVSATPVKKSFTDASLLKLPYTVEILQRIVTLTADDFGGAQEVTGEEIRMHFARSLNVLSLRRSEMVVFALVEPNKESEENYLFIDVLSPKQGYESCPFGKEMVDPEDPSKMIFRTRAGFFRRPIGTTNPCSFEWSLPLIPADVLGRAVGFFKEVFLRFGTESKGYILYSTQQQEYEFWVPSQEASESTVQAHPDAYRSGYAHIMDIHSHGRHPAKFSKSMDDVAAAVMNLIELQGVVGNLYSNEMTSSFRVVYSSVFGELEMSQLFSGIESLSELKVINPPEEWLTKVQILPPQNQKVQGGDW